jgi:hypothetical protein
MGRLNKEEYAALQAKYGELYSYSKYNTYISDPYTYFLNYVLHTPKDKPQNNFNILGEATHTLIENAYEKGWTCDQMLASFRESVINYQLIQGKFISSNDDINDSVEAKYIPCVEHYLKHFEPLPFEFSIEEMVDVMVGSYYFYGFVDMSHTEYDTEAHDYTVYITDFKTSSLYSPKDREDHKEQLLLYALAYSQKHRVPLSKIKLRWDFIKYVNVIFAQENGKIKIQAIERHKLCEFLCDKVSKWATKIGKDSFEILEMCENIGAEEYEKLPPEIYQRFKVEHCYVEIPFGQCDIDDLVWKIVINIDEANDKTDNYWMTKDDREFWKEVSYADSFYFNNLCEYSGKLHKPFGEYLEKHKNDWRNKK